jgi:hypothetical protein
MISALELLCEHHLDFYPVYSRRLSACEVSILLVLYSGLLMLILMDKCNALSLIHVTLIEQMFACPGAT